jgi:hypothetical protein
MGYQTFQAALGHADGDVYEVADNLVNVFAVETDLCVCVCV